jgi:hypothetical protein
MSKKVNHPPKAECLAIGMLMQHPEWNKTRIADAIGVHRGSLYRMPEFLRICAMIEELGIRDMPKGTKIVSRDDPKAPSGLEAWYDEPQEEADA